MSAQLMVRVARRPKYSDRLDGFIVSVGEKWAVLARISDGGFFDGFVAFRIKDVTKIARDRSFESAFARTQAEWPPILTFDVDLSSTRGVIEGLSLAAPIFGIQKDRERSAIWIGVLDELSPKVLWLHEVSPDASWHEAPQRYRLKAVRTVSIRNRYMTALAAMAGEPPSAEVD